ncbi:M50 family metallopeptidase [Rarobacter incanus]|uniref:Peptidase M50B-like protein n=1 Tax=Rarobacter incanus TaxID=153494 RepID=A0A542SQJ8_9MICO|nr:M50 family metallopeptidase [Rarobacter incanus]TQK76890.1 peptidase M50B-like protein [Rarobacter incanus]
MTNLATLWEHVAARTAPLDGRSAAIVGACVLVALAFPPVWALVRHVITIAHEGAHAVVGVVAGRKLKGIRLHSDTSGLTTSTGRAGGPGLFFTALAGYPGPAIVGLGCAAVVASGHATGLLWAWIAALAVMLVWVRNWFGILPIVGLGAVLGVILWRADPQLIQYSAYALTWLLVLGAVRPVIEMQVQRARSRGRSGSDADALARLTRIPGLFWVVVFLGVTCALGAVSALWLVTGSIRWFG